MEVVSTARKGFLINNARIINNVLVPKYYDPTIEHDLEAISKTHDLVNVNDLVEKGIIEVQQGKEVGKMEYGTGIIPFVRTSDIANWELVSNPKQGISEEVYATFGQLRKVKENDILLVRDGTYLVGNVCLITGNNTKIAYQSHISKIRIIKKDELDPFLLLAVLSCSIVQRQVYAKRLTADIIDTLGQRLFEIILPIPKNEGKRKEVIAWTKAIIEKRDEFRELIIHTANKIQGLRSTAHIPQELSIPPYVIPTDRIVDNILIPKYYNPEIVKILENLKQTHYLKTVGELRKEGLLECETGIEIGKMAYGTGEISFIRTSDISNWGLKSDPKQGVSEQIYQDNKQDVKENDILLVRDGTYLVGSSCLLTKNETKLLYCGGLYKIRTLNQSELNPFLLLGLLNVPIVRQQMRAKQFTRDVIDTIGKRFFEVALPIPKNKAKRENFSSCIESLMNQKYVLLEEQKRISIDVEKRV